MQKFVIQQGAPGIIAGKPAVVDDVVTLTRSQAAYHLLRGELEPFVEVAPPVDLEAGLSLHGDADSEPKRPARRKR